MLSSIICPITITHIDTEALRCTSTCTYTENHTSFVAASKVKPHANSTPDWDHFPALTSAFFFFFVRGDKLKTNTLRTSYEKVVFLRSKRQNPPILRQKPKSKLLTTYVHATRENVLTQINGLAGEKKQTDYSSDHFKMISPTFGALPKNSKGLGGGNWWGCCRAAVGAFGKHWGTITEL